MLATIREYALERLASGGSEEAARQAHAGYFLDIAEQFNQDLRGPRQGEWLQRLDREHDNLRRGPHPLPRYQPMGRGGAHGVFRVVVLARPGPRQRGPPGLEQTLASTPTKDRSQTEEETFQRMLAGLYNAAGSLAGAQGDYEGAAAFLKQSLEISRTQDDKRSMARTLNNLGIYLARQGI